MDDIRIGDSQKGLTRREALKRGAIVAGTLWAVPVVQAVGIQPAYAKQPSPGCRRYCLKWEPGGPSGGPTCPPDPGEGEDFLIPWTGAWSELGGKPDKGDLGAPASEQPKAKDDATSDTFPQDSVDGESGEDPGTGAGAESKSTPNGQPKAKDDATSGTSQQDGAGEEVDSQSVVAPGVTPDTAAKPDAPPKPPPGNCLDCPDEGINELPGSVRRFLRDNVAFYGSPETSFLVTFPPSMTLADVVDSPVAAAKCGSEQSGSGSSCNEQHQTDRVNSCEDDSNRSAVLIRSCSNGKAISHLEFIVDIC